MSGPELDSQSDPSRAADRASDPAGWTYPEEIRTAIARVIAERRDIRRFRPDPVPDEVLERLLTAAHRAPSVGLSQPWRFIVVRSEETRMRVRALAERERLRQAPRFTERSREFLAQKVEGIIEAPIGLCVCCVPPPPDVEVLGRATIPQTDLHSTACAIQNLWLTARAEGVGIGWVSFYEPPDMRATLGIPPEVEPVAWLCIGWPYERPVKPSLERAGWAARRPLDEFVMAERWSGPGRQPAKGPTPDAGARIAVRDHADELVKPTGSLGMLEDLVERWAAATGAAPPAPLSAAHLVFAADHGHTRHGTSAFDSTVTAQVAAASAQGKTAIGVLARARGERLLVVDVGLRGGDPGECLRRRVAPGTADIAAQPAMTEEQAREAIAVGRDAAGELLGETNADCLVLGEIGIGNTTTAAAICCAAMNVDSLQAVGRGTGLDAEGVVRKRAVVDAAVARHREAEADPFAPLPLVAGVGGFEFAALVGAIHAAYDRGAPTVLDGFATTVAALIAVRLEPGCREWLIAGHRSAEPAHGLILTELGLEPLLDLRVRLGEGTGAALALSLIEHAGRLHREMATFAEAGVDRA
jgi:nicotinate-nucleotide--dimethylbenzimidazole phosphoribosyltransferase